ncbi:hypothetical protein K437DRAFT_90383 [Tilletiaria anomala UBC 951]|uniref:Glyoxalase/fosfomycin resistance/dioxygenase domain-containing protein n=1 Tax=Tilletiaria anomala (strain ATCC 24038 / CBS 436.72 / UBC 951) TaxID=1037660 RepID=A0A066W605_TILAU|nr:uncharacterized protein K437DRAFT_90383 [Tilletiaria anomala UBC 951]KDN47968.1 hypothetical protein K437DRAFT_90383 [Tilletiaria anomala UBC 951]
MMRAIPCLMVSDIASALPFYKEILGFVNVSKPDKSLANICRTPSGKPMLQGAEEGVQLYLRTPYPPPQPQDPPFPPMSVHVEVANVDDMFDEIYYRAQRTHPSEDDYFPAFQFGKARIHGRPQNTSFGTREIRINDADANLLVFFQDIRAAPQASNSNIVRGPVERKVKRR